MRINKKHRRTFLTIELVVGFGPIALVAAIGVLFAGYQVLFLVTSEEARAHPAGSLQVISLSVLGVLALIGLLNLFLAILDPKDAFLSPKVTLLLGIPGLLILAYLVLYGATGHWGWQLFFLIPLATAVHFLHLGRDFLLTASNPDD